MLLKFGHYWKERNLEKVLDFFTEDAIYLASIGTEPGTSYRGKQEIRNGIIEMFSHDNIEDIEVDNILIFENFGFWQWTYTTKEGEKILGCDAFKFRSNKIVKKNAFRKLNIK